MSIFNTFVSHFIPDSAPAPFKAGFRLLIPLALVLWAADVISAARLIPAALGGLLGRAAETATIIAAVCWAASVRYDAERRAEKRATVALLAELAGDPEPPASHDRLHAV